MTEIRTRRVGAYTYGQVAKAIDHSLLKPELTEADVIAGCELAKQYHVASVCVRPCDVPLAARLLAGGDVAVGTVIGFPHGAHTTAVKVFEADDAMANGAVELDLVLNIGQLRSGNLGVVGAEIAAVVAAAKRGRALVKVILENAYLTDGEKIAACALAAEAGADFVKTSTGYAPTGATIEDLRLMRTSPPTSGSRPPAACARSTRCSPSWTPARPGSVPPPPKPSSTTSAPARRPIPPATGRKTAGRSPMDTDGRGRSRRGVETQGNVGGAANG